MALPNFPYTDFHRLNADWILKTVRTCAQKVKEAAQTVETYADRLLQVETDVTLLEGTVSTVSGHLTTLSGSAVQVVPQTFSDTQKAQARTNIGAASTTDIPQDAVRYGTVQSLSDAQKSRARTNIGAVSASDIPQVSGVVRYDTVQSLSDAQKAQARTNIGAVNTLEVLIEPDELGTGYVSSETRATIIDAVNNGIPVHAVLYPVGSTERYDMTMSCNETTGDVTLMSFQPNDASAAHASTWYRVFMSGNTITVTAYDARMVPATSISDNTKILNVANGRPTWSDMCITLDGTGGTVNINTLSANWGVRPIIVTAIVDGASVQAQVVSYAGNYYSATYTITGGTKWIRIGAGSGNIFT